MGEGVYRSSILQVSHYADLKVVQPSELLVDGEQVKEGLGGVLVGAVAGVITGTVAVSLASLAAPSTGCLMTMASQ